MSIRAIITGRANNQLRLEIKCHSESVSRHRHITSARPVTATPTAEAGAGQSYVVLCFVYDSSDIV